jgi:hypothetical protein
MPEIVAITSGHQPSLGLIVDRTAISAALLATKITAGITEVPVEFFDLAELLHTKFRRKASFTQQCWDIGRRAALRGRRCQTPRFRPGSM